MEQIRNAMHRLLVGLLKAPIMLYRYGISPFFPAACRFQPSCSDYALQALQQHGLRGLWLAGKRLCRCHPFGGHGIDPVPTSKHTSC